MIRLENMTKIYPNGVTALNNVSLQIQKGEFVFVVGNSGSGKTTLIKLLMKELQATEGKIMIDNKDITKLKKRYVPILRRNIGVVFQDFRLLDKMSVYDNVAFALKVTEESSKKNKKDCSHGIIHGGLIKKS